ncbi:hypothetical protein CYMTET_3078 [Cymbomonas tetramitiformis]|uniref:Uncharacterized protein n=1 Tax=Cymbomonas tetramitiformis TaxID=36881 RepID=A0AAE0BDH1_9CHLO|nr:hypothetical protein CYMTET_55319 [Cymbomonas tetramitiformis]KAK3250418.1 hypothetical protein CYMTET_40196 [Cymbomonas tetramitiformis]KAK3289466.1 hypothetical protein CYMTET_3078 [Cymbomonas tetramitiformis]
MAVANPPTPSVAFADEGDIFEPVLANVRHVPARWGESCREAGSAVSILLKDTGRGRYPNARIDATRFKYCLPTTNWPPEVCQRLIDDAKRSDCTERAVVHLFSVRQTRSLLTTHVGASREYYMGAHVVCGVNKLCVPRFVVLRRLRDQRAMIERYACPSLKRPRDDTDSVAEEARREEDLRSVFVHAVAMAMPQTHTVQLDCAAIDTMRACPNSDGRYRDAVPEREVYDVVTADIRRGQRVVWCCATPDVGRSAVFSARCRALRDVGLHRVIAVLPTGTKREAEQKFSDCCDFVDYEAVQARETRVNCASALRARLTLSLQV